MRSFALFLLAGSLLAQATPLGRLGGATDLGAGCGTGLCGEKRFLTPLIQEGKIKEALEVSRTQLFGSDFPAHAGLLTVRGNASLFFVLQPCETGPDPNVTCADDELTLWLQGGPGGPSQFGLFVENGPYHVTKDLQLQKNPYSWTRRFAMVWIDQPVGTGFSSVGDPSQYCHDDLCSARDLYSALEQLTALFPQYRKLRVSAESYGGKWAPSISSYILRQQEADAGALGGMKLVGMSMGDGWTDPINMLPRYVPLLAGGGFLDEHGLASFGGLINEAIANTTNGNLAAAFRAWDAAINGDLIKGPPLLERLTGLKDYFNYERTTQPESYNYWSEYVVQPAVRKALGVGNTTLHSGLEVELNLMSDFMVSQADNLAYILDSGVPVLVYVGQLDIIVGPCLVDAYLPKVSWKGQQQYKDSIRSVWTAPSDPSQVAGWTRAVSADSLTHVVIRGVGHIAPHDNPARVFDLIVTWADGKPLA